MPNIQTLSVTIPTRFDYDLSAWVKGEVTSDTLAILLPGFLDTKDYQHLTRLGEQLSQVGYVTLAFDPLGIWESRAPIEYYTITNWLVEIEDVIDWVKTKWKNIKHVLLVGHSMGAMISMLFAQRHPEINAVVAVMGPHAFVRKETYESRMVKWRAEQFKISHRDAPNGKESTTITLPFSFVQDSVQYDVLKSGQSINCPILLIAGEKDQLVPAEYVRDIFNQLPASRKELVTLADIGHDYRKRVQDIEHVDAQILSFFEKNS